MKDFEKHEQDVINVITSLGKGYYSVNNAIFKNQGYINEIDSILICKAGIFIIEAKYWVGKVTGKTEDLIWQFEDKNGLQDKFSPIKQNEKHITMVSTKFKIPKEEIHSIVVFSNDVDLSEIEDENVIHLDELKEYILLKTIPSIYSKKKCDRIRKLMVREKGKNSDKRKKSMMRKCLKKNGYSPEDVARIVGDRKYYSGGKLYG